MDRSYQAEHSYLGMACRKTTEVPKEKDQEKENTVQMGEQVGRRAQTASYTKENELRRDAGASQTGCSLKEGAGKYDSMDFPGKQLIGEKKEKVMRINILKEKIEKVEKEMKKEVEVKEQLEVELEVAVVLVVGMEVKVKMVPLKKLRKEVQVREIMKEVKVKRDKIPMKWWK
ncbi:hypothetical protein Scep_014572 [Stephania cephalantha]|uniref:Uncharacterized protein n=1 Tax=Stephania cephalantha TaxID=152367 RepID=A0AAP0P358_9MAGN